MPDHDPDLAGPPQPSPYSDDRPPLRASSFKNQRRADKFLIRLHARNEQGIKRWLELLPDRLLALDGDLGRTTGYLADPTGTIHDVTGVRMVLAKDADNPDGYQLLTGYPASVARRRLALPGLDHLCGAYFHQDWDVEHGTEGSAVAAFVEQSPTWAPRLVAEMDDLFRIFDDDDFFAALLVVHGCEFRLWEGESARAWLQDVVSRTRAGLMP